MAARHYMIPKVCLRWLKVVGRPEELGDCNFQLDSSCSQRLEMLSGFSDAALIGHGSIIPMIQ